MAHTEFNPVSISSSAATMMGRAEFDGAAHCLIHLAGVGRLIESLGEQTCILYLDEFRDRLQSLARPQDSIVRISPAKFGLILKGVTDREHLELAGAKIARLFEEPADLFGDAISFDVHAGLVAPTETALTSKALVRHAESALRLAAASDEAFVILDHHEVTQEQFDPSLLPRIERALASQEFRLHYQAKVRAKFRTIIGAEALIRWYQEDAKKVLPPSAFLETAEANTIIQPMTDFVIRSAIGRCARWRSPTSVAVNVTPRLLETPALAAVIKDALEFYAVEEDRLVVEITERSQISNAAIDGIGAIRDLGVKISIDDFGTGLSSLTYFRDIPADQIKIDRSFVQAMARSKKDHAIVRGLIDLAHHCGIEVVAEGVEDERIADELTEMECDVLQGYWFAKPIEADEFEREFMGDFGAADIDPDLFSALLKETV